MKKGIFLLLSMIAMFYACDYAGDIKDYKEDWKFMYIGRKA